MYQCAVIKVAAMSIEENYLVVDRGCAAYFVELGHGFKPPASINISRWCVVYFTVQWYVEVEIFKLLLGLVHNDVGIYYPLIPD